MATSTRSACLDRATLAILARGTIPAERVQEIADHLRQCQRCLRVVARGPGSRSGALERALSQTAALVPPYGATLGTSSGAKRLAVVASVMALTASAAGWYKSVLDEKRDEAAELLRPRAAATASAITEPGPDLTLLTPAGDAGAAPSTPGVAPVPPETPAALALPRPAVPRRAVQPVQRRPSVPLSAPLQDRTPMVDGRRIRTTLD